MPSMHLLDCYAYDAPSIRMKPFQTPSHKQVGPTYFETVIFVQQIAGLKQRVNELLLTSEELKNYEKVSLPLSISDYITVGAKIEINILLIDYSLE